MADSLFFVERKLAVRWALGVLREHCVEVADAADDDFDTCDHLFLLPVVSGWQFYTRDMDDGAQITELVDAVDFLTRTGMGEHLENSMLRLVWLAPQS